MLSRQAKAAFYTLAGPLMAANGVIYRHLRAPRTGTILTFSYLEELMTQTGFVDIRSCPPIRETCAPELFADCLKLEFESDLDTPHTLIVEAQKPCRSTDAPGSAR